MVLGKQLHISVLIYIGIGNSVFRQYQILAKKLISYILLLLLYLAHGSFYVNSILYNFGRAPPPPSVRDYSCSLTDAVMFCIIHMNVLYSNEL